jgi:SWIM zinc finger
MVSLQSLDILDPLIIAVTERGIETPIQVSAHSNVTNVTNVDEILRSADFLYGSTLDGALSLLETDPRRNILLLKSLQSERCMYVVKGNVTSSRSNSSNPYVVDASYICMLPSDILNKAENPLITSRNANQSFGYYCSCRSFLEHCRTGHGLCKHLLAIKLMRPLGVECSVIELVSDLEYCKVALQRMTID